MDGISVRANQGITQQLTDQLRSRSESQGIGNSPDFKTTDVDSSGGIQKSFSETLTDAIGKVNQLQRQSDVATQNLATGRSDNIADVMIASEKADIALRVMVQVRNKIIDAYQEIMKMQV